MITMVQKGVLIPLSLLLAACSSQPQAGEDGSVRGYTQTGLASYYADRYHNKRTASGELHKRGGNTAAHMTLPFGTQVKVTNLDNDRSVVVRINDRGPHTRGRLIDLSRKAAEQLGMISSGTARVRVQALSN